MEDGRCRLGLGGRRELVRLIEEGASLRAAARRLGVAPATAHRWWHRWRAASAPERASLACLAARPPRPHSCPWMLGADQERAILEARSRTNLGPARLAGLVGRRRSTIWKVLARHGRSRRRRSSPPARPGYECSWRAFSAPATSPTATGQRPTAAAAPATCTPTAPSMTTAAWPTSSCTPIRALRPAPPSSAGRPASWPRPAAGRPRR
jgi:transposase-like protein